MVWKDSWCGREWSNYIFDMDEILLSEWWFEQNLTVLDSGLQTFENILAGTDGWIP